MIGASEQSPDNSTLRAHVVVGLPSSVLDRRGACHADIIPDVLVVDVIWIVVANARFGFVLVVFETLVDVVGNVSVIVDASTIAFFVATVIDEIAKDEGATFDRIGRRCGLSTDALIWALRVRVRLAHIVTAIPCEATSHGCD